MRAATDVKAEITGMSAAGVLLKGGNGDGVGFEEGSGVIEDGLCEEAS